MTEKIIVLICEIILTIATLSCISVIIAATWHDLRAAIKKARLRKIEQDLSDSRRLAVAVVIYTRNDGATIGNCLNALITSEYLPYKILVTDDASNDETVRIVKRYKKSHPRIPITILEHRQITRRTHLLSEASKRCQKSDLVLMINATDRLPSTALRQSVAHFIASKQLAALKFRSTFEDDVMFSSLSGYFIYLTKNIFNKALSWRSIGFDNIHQSGIMIRVSLLAAHNSTNRVAAMYDSTIVISSPRSVTYVADSARQHPIARLLIMLGLIISISMMTYFFYTAATLHSAAFLTLSWMLVNLWLIAIVWSDAVLGLAKKIALTFSVPFSYFLLYVQLYIMLAKTSRQLLLQLRLPKFSLSSIHQAILQEAYSTRF